jgi:hypothetical protein
MTSPKNNEAAPVWTPPTPEAEGSAGAMAAADVEPVTAEAISAARRPVRVRRSGSTPVLLAIGALMAVGGVGFAVGHLSGSGQTGTGQQNGANGLPAGQFGPGASGRPDSGGLLGGGFTISGTVVSVFADSITLKLADGSTTTIAIDSSTAYHSQEDATIADVTAGDTVSVQTSGGGPSGQNAGASASPGTANRTATDVTITSQ